MDTRTFDATDVSTLRDVYGVHVAEDADVPFLPVETGDDSTAGYLFVPGAPVWVTLPNRDEPARADTEPSPADDPDAVQTGQGGTERVPFQK